MTSPSGVSEDASLFVIRISSGPTKIRQKKSSHLFFHDFPESS